MTEVPGYPVPRSLWVASSESCATCGKRFSFFTSKSNCPCCGKLCCSDCVQAECTVISGSSPSKVCIDCFSMLQRYRGSVTEKDLSLQETQAICTSSTQLDSKEEKETHIFTNENPECNNITLNSSTIVENSNNSNIIINNVEELIKSSEFLRKENEKWIEKTTEQEQQIKELCEQRDIAITNITAKEKEICDIKLQNQKNEEEAKNLREELNQYRLRLEGMEKEIKNATQNSKSDKSTNDKINQNSKENDSQKEKNSQFSKDVTLNKSKVNEVTSSRKLPLSIVRDTVLTVVPPKPRVTLDLGVNISDWSFDSMEVASRVPSVLQTVAGEIAVQWKLFSSEGVAQKWAYMTAAVENNYLPNPYHNAVHAADVLQGMFALVSTAPSLIQNMTLVEKRAAAFSAMAHDLRHPARTNAFLAAIHDPVSFKFPGRGTLEQMHTATAFELLSVPEFDFTSDMDDASFLEFKNIVTRLIAHTDMSIHNESVARWGGKVGKGGFDCERIEDRIEALSLILHAADIGATARGVTVARKWLVVLDEFADQADDERLRGLPVTPGFDRPQSVERSQIPFLDFCVIPLFDVLHQLFPTVEEPLHNLRALRELYATTAGVTSPFPLPVDYTNHEAKLKEMEATIAECRRREEELWRNTEVLEQSTARNVEAAKEEALQLRSELAARNEELRILRKQHNIPITSSRKLPLSIVRDTVLTVVPPKPRVTLDLGVNISDWSFDSMEVASRVPSVLQTVAGEIAVQWKLFSSEGVAQKWAYMTAAVENNYLPNPYHNAVHAADVLQGMFALVSTAPSLIQNMTLVEKRAAAFSAMAHDLRHPARTNAFLAAIHDPVSFKFPGRGTLEQMHTATAFELLSVPEFDFTSDMDDASFLEFKNIVTRLIAHTDMSIHNESVARWGGKVGKGGFDCERIEDRIEALSLILHAADIGATARGVTVARKWLVVLDEFADQADDERLRGLPVTPGFDRPQSVERSQIPFLDFCVIPLFDVLHQLFPTVEEPLHNLRALRELYATTAGVTSPFPLPVDYTNHEAKLKEMEATIAECRRREEDFHRYLDDMKAAGGKLKKKSAALKIKEEELNIRLHQILEKELKVKTDLSKVEEIANNEIERRRLLDLETKKETDDVNIGTVDSNQRLDGLIDRNELLAARERTIYDREVELEATANSMNKREKKLATFSERLAEIAESVHKERERFQNVNEREAAILRRESALKQMETVAIDQTRLALMQREAEERLARKYDEVDELLLIVRAMRLECLGGRDSEIRKRALCATLAEREAAIAEAVELSRKRRQQAAQLRATHPIVTHLDRLENAIFQLTAAITMLKD